jgi:tetratricopeptide (TPR) repeat protein
MNLADERLGELDNPSLTADERALLRSQVAADLIHKGQYEAAREALGELWRGIGERPNVEGLDENTAAEVLQQVGALSGWMGASLQAKGAQDAAKDLLSESAAVFERVGETAKAAFARSDLALCYWREGAYDEARILLTRASEELADEDAERRAIVLLRWVTVECAAGRFDNALGLLKESEHILQGSENHALLGSFHNLYAVTLRRLGAVEGHGDYYDRAIIEYTAAAYHLEQARHERYVGRIENNLAFILYKLGRHREAHEHLDRAQSIFTRLRDAGSLAQVDETRARVLVAERRYRDADRTLAGVLKTLEKGDESALLADALTVQGVIWARLWAYEGSITVLRRAAEVAEAVGARTSAGQALLALIEEHGATWRMSPAEVYKMYLRADRLLKGTQNAEDITRLRACAPVVMKRLTTVQFGDKNFTLPGAVHEFEAKLIEQALEETGGSITKAARLLGLTHQTLGSILNTRHKKLSAKRTPARKRLKSIIKKPED